MSSPKTAAAATGRRELVYQAPAKEVPVEYQDGSTAVGELRLVEQYLPYEAEEPFWMPPDSEKPRKTETRHRVRILEQLFVDGQPTPMGRLVCECVVDITVRH